MRSSHHAPNPMPVRLLLAGVVLNVLAGAPLLHAATINVPADHASIQDALNAASPGDTILVAAGTYPEHSLSFLGKDVILRSAAGPATTIIDGGGFGRVFVLTGGLTRAAVIEGFTIRNGSSPGGGAGIWMDQGVAPTIRGNWILDNSAGDTGGGIKARGGSNPLIEQNLIDGNEADEGGGGVHITRSTAQILDNVITDNVATQTPAITGGGIKVTFATAAVLIRDNEIRRNTVSGGGAGISCFDGDLDVINNQITDNVAGELGGGVLFEADDDEGPRTGRMLNNEILRNVAPEIGGGIHTYLENTASTVEITGNTIEDNESVNLAVCSGPLVQGCGKGGALGIYLGNGQARQTVRYNVLRNNRADLYGGALMIGTGSVKFTFADNDVESNTSRFGFPAIGCVDTGECRVTHSRFINNWNDAATMDATRNPGAIYLRNSGVTYVENNYFRGNLGQQAGAILLFNLPNKVAVPDRLIRNNTFVDNGTTLSFGATLWIEVDAMVANNIFSGDVRGIRTSGSPAVDVRNNDFFSTKAYRGDTTHDTVGGLNGESFASANVDSDPGFEMADDLFLSDTSPLLSAGRCDLAPSDDFHGDLRPFGDGCEIGADEFNPYGVGLIFADGFESGDTSLW